MDLTKEEALKKIEELKKYIAEKDIKKTAKTVILNKEGKEIYSSDKESLREAVIDAVSKGANLYGADLCEANLGEANLCEANLGEANLGEADLCRANLRRADLGGANLGGANLYGANLYGANLCGADLCGANLCEADLENAKFYGKGGTQKLKKDQVEVFLKALGFIVK